MVAKFEKFGEQLIIVSECGGKRNGQCDTCEHRFVCWTEKPEIITYKEAFIHLTKAIERMTGISLRKHNVLYR